MGVGNLLGENACGEACSGLEKNTVAKNGRSGGLDVVRNQENAAFASSQGSRNEKKTDRGTRAGAQRQRRPIARAAHQRDDIGTQRRLDSYATDVPPRRRPQSPIHW